MPTARSTARACSSSEGLRMHVTVRWWHIVPLSKFNCFMSPLICSFVHLLSCLFNFCGHICGAATWSSVCVVGLVWGCFVTASCLSVRSFSVTVARPQLNNHLGWKDNDNLVTVRRNILRQSWTKSCLEKHWLKNKLKKATDFSFLTFISQISVGHLGFNWSGSKLVLVRLPPGKQNQ